jgi:hypothetical protein
MQAAWATRHFSSVGGKVALPQGPRLPACSQPVCSCSLVVTTPARRCRPASSCPGRSWRGPDCWTVWRRPPTTVPDDDDSRRQSLRGQWAGVEKQDSRVSPEPAKGFSCLVGVRGGDNEPKPPMCRHRERLAQGEQRETEGRMFASCTVPSHRPCSRFLLNS